MTAEENSKAPKKNRQRGKNRRIGFTQEIVTKNVAKSLLSQEDRAFIIDPHIKKLKETVPKPKQSPLKKKKIKSDKMSSGIQIQETKVQQNTITNSKINKRKEFDVGLSCPKEDNEEQIFDKNTPFKFKKQKVDNKLEDVSTKSDIETKGESEGNKDPERSSSKRALKKMKYQKLLEEQKNKVDILLKQKALNYLSNWKHDKINWKFEKLKQIWLLQNLYDVTKIEDNIWETVVEYFSNSQGKVHKMILNEAIKIVENGNNSVDNNEKKLDRARDIIQNLQD